MKANIAATLLKTMASVTIAYATHHMITLSSVWFDVELPGPDVLLTIVQDCNLLFYPGIKHEKSNAE